MWAALVAALLAGSGSAHASQPIRVVFVSARTPVAQLYSVEPSGRGLAQLTFGKSDWGDPLVSPNGRFVVAVSGRSFWVMRPDGRRAQPIARDAYELTWSGNSKRLAFVRDKSIWTIAPTGGRPRPIADATDVISLSLSPDGAAVAASRLLNATTSSLVVTRKGRETTVATSLSTIVAPAWSPDGKSIAFLTTDGALELAAPAGGAPRVLAQTGSVPPLRLAWSPDGRHLAYDGPDGVHVVSRAGSDAQLLAPGGSRGIAWSPESDAVAFLGSGGPAVVTLDGRVRTIFSASIHDDDTWAGIGWTAGRRSDRYRAAAPLTPLVEISDRELRAHVPIGAFAADGDRVAYSLCPHVLGAWRPGDAQQAALGDATVEACSPPRDPNTPGSKTYDLALAGDRVAYLFRGRGFQFAWSLMETTLDSGTDGAAIAGDTRCCTNDPDVPPLADVEGSGSLLVYGAWSATAPESIWRLDGSTPVEIARGSGGLQPLDVDGGRVVARRADRSLELLSSDGVLLRTFDVPALGAALAGDDLVVLVQGELRDYSASSGALLHAWPLPDVPSSGRCRRPSCPRVRLTLLDAGHGLALYSLDDAVHLLRLADGADSVVPFAVAGVLGDTGLFATYAGQEPWPGRIRFVPFAELPL